MGEAAYSGYGWYVDGGGSHAGVLDDPDEPERGTDIGQSQRAIY